MYASTHISNRVFYIPFVYYYVVRLGTIPKLLSWMLIFIFPTAWYTAMPGWAYLAMLVSLFTIYELGYIQNDTEAITHENHPTIRLYPQNMDYYHSHKWSIVAVRVLIGLPFLPVLLLFMAYNKVRDPRLSPLLYPVLVCSRYLPLVLYRADSLHIVLLLLSFPLINAIERFSMPKYRFPLMRNILPSEQSKTYFRAIYYIVLTLVLIALNINWYDMFPIFVLGAFRIGIVILTRFYTPRNYLNG